MPIKFVLNTASKMPRRHAVSASVIAAFLISFGLIEPASSSIERTRLDIAIPAPLAEPVALPESEDEAALYQTVSVKKGDTLSDLFERHALPLADMYALLKSSKEGKRLTQLRPDEAFSYRLADGRITEWIRHTSALKSIKFTKSTSGFSHSTTLIKPDRRLAYKAASLNYNLFDAAQSVGIPSKITMEMAGIFGGVMDFVYDPRKGDTFSILYEDLYVDGEHIGYGNIIAASYHNKGDSHEAFRYENKQGKGTYYNAQGVSMRKAFLRAPVDFTRISSNFNPNRLHPIFKTKRPHRGIDYAASTGTPVFAAGNGRVIKSTYNKASGNYVVIQHGPRYQTKYLHLNKRKVRLGQKISQGQVLGTVGSTGYATGAHLHYEFLLDGVHRNPRTILNKLPKAQSIATNERSLFKLSIKPIQEQFSAYQKTTPFVIASNDKDQSPKT